MAGKPWSRADASALLAVGIGGAAVLTLLGAWGFQALGYPPCELCLRERVPYYAGAVAAAVAALAARRGRADVALAGFTTLIVVFAAGAAMGVYHAGVEQALWPGPGACSGAIDAPAKASDFFERLSRVSVVRCDRPALLVSGLSLAAWNAVIATGLAALSIAGVVRAGGPGAFAP